MLTLKLMQWSLKMPEKVVGKRKCEYVLLSGEFLHNYHGALANRKKGFRLIQCKSNWPNQCTAGRTLPLEMAGTWIRKSTKLLLFAY
jgi:hypothetical protein